MSRKLSFVYEETEMIERIDRLRDECVNIGAIIEKALLDYKFDDEPAVEKIEVA